MILWSLLAPAHAAGHTLEQVEAAKVVAVEGEHVRLDDGRVTTQAPVLNRDVLPLLRPGEKVVVYVYTDGDDVVPVDSRG